MHRRRNASVNCLASANETERFRAAIGRQIGLRFDDAKLAFLGQVLQRRLREKGWSSEAYLRELEYQPSGSELSALARELTVGETYFFVTTSNSARSPRSFCPI